jgi:hypothetical protein
MDIVAASADRPTRPPVGAISADVAADAGRTDARPRTPACAAPATLQAPQRDPICHCFISTSWLKSFAMDSRLSAARLPGKPTGAGTGSMSCAKISMAARATSVRVVVA